MKWYKMTPFPTTYCLTTPEELKKWCVKRKLTMPEIPEENIGTTLTFGGKFAILVDAKQHKSHWSLVDTVIHESVHIFQGAMNYIGERNVGSELEAYTIASIATNMLKEYHALHEGRKTGLQT